MSISLDPLQDVQRTAAWVRAAQAGDREAFGRLFERYRGSVLAIAQRRLRNADAAQELCQDVFVQALLKLDQLRAAECFGGWLRQITIRLAINRCQRRRVPAGVESPAAIACEDRQADPLQRCQAAEEANRIRTSLRRLRPLDRQTLTAFYVRGRSLAEMAEDFAAPLGTIKRRLHVARKRLAEALR